MTKAFGYLRVSGRGQINGDGPERQELAIRNYAAANDIEIVQIFFEKGICGEIETMERPEFINMMTALLSNGVRTVIVEKLDRLSRHLITQETCVADFSKQGLSLRSADPAEFDLMASDPGRVLVRQIFGAIAQYDKAMLVAKLRAARNRKKLATGRCEGGIPFGLRPGEEATLNRIMELRSEGLTHRAIAELLNSDGVPARPASSGKAGRWHESSISLLARRHTKGCGKPHYSPASSTL